MTKSMVIRAVTPADIPVLDQQVKAAFGRTFNQELAEQEQGIHSLFIAAAGAQVYGWSFIRWLGPRDPEAAELFPDAPEIYRLEVLEQHRSGGIGQRIIEALEDEARARSYRAISLGVGHENPRAYALYQRLGYQNTSLDAYYDEYDYPLSDGEVGHAKDLCRYLVKPLSNCANSVSNV